MRKIQFEVWSAYKSQLKLYNKDIFDPFCRTENEDIKKKIKESKKKKKFNTISKKLFRFYYSEDNKEDYIETTMGQLNFFRWIITNKILDYIDVHKEEIEKEMLIDNNKKKEKKRKIKNGVRVKVGKSSVSAVNTFTKNKTNIIVSFGNI